MWLLGFFASLTVNECRQTTHSQMRLLNLNEVWNFEMAAATQFHRMEIICESTVTHNGHTVKEQTINMDFEAAAMEPNYECLAQRFCLWLVL